MKSRESAAHKLNRQCKQSVRKEKKTKGCSSGKCNATNKKQPQVNNYDEISMINLFCEDIACGPEYVHVCTSCDQLWYKCSVVKYNPNKYKACSPDMVESSLNGFKSVDDTKRQVTQLF